MLPNFLVIGAAKSGTTALYQYLSQHPAIFMPRLKEPKFFSYEGGVPAYTNFPKQWKNGSAVTDRSAYERLFDRSGGCAARGEASTLYLYYPGTAERIHRYVPNMRLICLLRHPADRAFSHHQMLQGIGLEDLSFEEALAQEEERIARNWAPTWHYAATGRYAEQLKRYRALFPCHQLKTVFYDDFRSDPRAVMREMFSFLGVEPEVQIDLSTVHNVTRVPKRGLAGPFLRMARAVGHDLRPLLPAELHRRASRLIKDRMTQKAPTIAPETRLRLTAHFADDILALQELTGRDLSSWLEGAVPDPASRAP